MDRREFIKATASSAIVVTAAGLTTAGLTTAGMTASSYARILGANDRIRIGGIGPGDRGSGRVVTAANSAAVTSEWFLVDSRIRLDRAALDAQSLIYRPSTPVAGGTRVMWTREN